WRDGPRLPLADSGAPVPSAAMYSMSGRGSGGGRGTTLREQIASACLPIAWAAATPAASADRSVRLTVSSTPASSASRPAAVANGTAAAARAVIFCSPGDSEACSMPSSPSGGHAVPAGRAVVPGAAQPHRAHHRVDGLGPAGDEPGLVAVPAACARAAMPGIHSQQVFQQAAAQLQHRGADHQLHRLQALAGCQRAGRLDGQGRYLGGDLRRERLAEPPLSPAGPAGEPPAADVTGLASQIASLTSTICSQSAVNSL